jgi:hypothetical protein
MNAVKVAELARVFAACQACGSTFVNNGEGSISITDDTFKRDCKCGWGIQMKEDTPLDRIVQSAEQQRNLLPKKEFRVTVNDYSDRVYGVDEAIRHVEIVTGKPMEDKQIIKMLRELKVGLTLMHGDETVTYERLR